MAKSTNHSQRPRRNITWQSQPQPAPTCQHQYETVSGGSGLTFRQCTKCGHQEAK